MKHYRVPYRIHGNAAKTKAELHYVAQLTDGFANSYRMVPAPGALFVEFDAPSHAEAGRMLQEVILGEDPRPVMGRSNVRYFAGDGQATAATHFDDDDGRENIAEGDYR